MELQNAVETGDIDKVERIIEAGGVDVNLQDSGGLTLLMRACRKGQTRVVQYLCHKGADINIQDYQGYTALTHAAANRRVNTIRELISRHAKVGIPVHYPANMPKPTGDNII
jgi:hypothetical protein